MKSHVYAFFVSLLLIEKISSASDKTKDTTNDTSNFTEDSSLCEENSITDVNNLGFKLLNILVSQQGNVFLSPIGVAFSLGILYAAASNETAKQIGKVLIRNESKVTPAKVEEELNQIMGTLRNVETNFSIVNEIFFEDCKYINEEYISALKDNNVDEVSVVYNADIMTEIIDVLNSTKNDSDTLFSEKIQTPLVKVVNSFSFNNSWKVQFVAERTVRDYFYSGKRETTEVWMMTIEAENFKFYEDLEMRYKFIEMPYGNDHMSMILALPIQYDQPANLQLNTETYCAIKAKLIPTKLDMVSIPKLKFSEDISVKKELDMLGIKDAFNESYAQFPGLSAEENFHVDDVSQKITLEVDEDGHEAGSLTKLNFKPVAFRGVKEFIANHPFLFYVEDRKTGTILLSGRVDEPSESISFTERLLF